MCLQLTGKIAGKISRVAEYTIVDTSLHFECWFLKYSLLGLTSQMSEVFIYLIEVKTTYKKNL